MHVLFFEWGSIVSNNGRGNPIVANNVVWDKLGHLDNNSEGKGDGFHPFGEILYCSNDKIVSI